MLGPTTQRHGKIVVYIKSNLMYNTPMNKLNYSDVAASIKSFSNASYEDHGSFSYACGTFESMLSYLVAELPKHKQMEFMKALDQAMKRVSQPA